MEDQETFIYKKDYNKEECDKARWEDQTGNHGKREWREEFMEVIATFTVPPLGPAICLL